MSYVTDIQFTVGYDWPECNVDAAIAPHLTFGSPESVDSKTPTAESVDRALEELWQDEELKGQGIEVAAWCGLMMGCCSVEFKVEAERVNELSDLIDFARKRLDFYIEIHVEYYQDGDVVSPTICSKFG
jgi:hypothetical protein